MDAILILFLSAAAAAMSELFIPLIAEGMGASRLEIGFVVSVYGLMALASFYIFGRVSDSKGRLVLIRCGMLLSALAFLMQVLAGGWLTLLLARAVCGFAIGVFYSSLIIYGVECGRKLGRYTAYESLGCGAGTLLAGFIAVYYGVFIFSSVFFFISFLIALRLPDVKSERVETPLIPFRIVKRNWRTYLPLLMRDVGGYSIWGFLPIYLVGLGADKLWIGILYLINSGGQFVVKQFVDRFNYSRLFAWGLLLSAVTFYGYSLATSYLHVIPLHLVLAAAWSALSVGAMGSLTRKNPEKATVIGLFSSARSVAAVVGPVIGGVITQYWGFTALMLFSGTLTMAGLGAYLIKRR